MAGLEDEELAAEIAAAELEARDEEEAREWARRHPAPPALPLPPPPPTVVLIACPGCGHVLGNLALPTGTPPEVAELKARDLGMWCNPCVALGRLPGNVELTDDELARAEILAATEAEVSRVLEIHIKREREAARLAELDDRDRERAELAELARTELDELAPEEE